MAFRVLSVDDSNYDDDRWREALLQVDRDGSALVTCDLPGVADVGDVMLFRSGASDEVHAWGKVLKRRKLKPSTPGDRVCDVDVIGPSPGPWAPSSPEAAHLPVVRIVDFGGSPLFEQAATATAENLRALLPQGAADQVSLEIVRTTAVAVVGEAIADGEPRLVHVMSHGEAHRVGGFLAAETGETFSFQKLAAHLAKRRRGRGQSVGARALLLDACDSGRGDFPSQVAALLDHPMLFVGATREVQFDEATCYFNCLYAAMAAMGMFSVQESDPSGLGLEAARRAVDSYEVLRRQPAPFTARVLRPIGGLWGESFT